MCARGPPDALAVACWRGVTAWAPAGSGLLEALAPALADTGLPVMIEAQGDTPGRRDSDRLWGALCEAGAQARIKDSPDGMDPAECLAVGWGRAPRHPGGRRHALGQRHAARMAGYV